MCIRLQRLFRTTTSESLLTVSQYMYTVLRSQRRDNFRRTDTVWCAMGYLHVRWAPRKSRLKHRTDARTSTMAPAYASEVAPLALRSYLETWVVTCWGIGQFFSYAVLFSLNKRTDQWAYRIPFGVQWVWPAVIIPLAVFCPESPWWLVRTGQYDKAERTIRRLTSAKTKEQADDQAKKALALMIETNKFEVENGEKISYSACFATPSDRRRSEIAMVSWGLQVTTGFVIQGTNTSGGLRVVGSR